MFRLKTSETVAWDTLQSIPNVTCQAEASTHWRVRPDGTPSAQSVCWLFCWATPQAVGPKTATAAREAFDAILDPSYAWAEKRLTYEWASQARDTHGDIESLFAKVLERG